MTPRKDKGTVRELTYFANTIERIGKTLIKLAEEIRLNDQRQRLEKDRTSGGPG